MDTETKIRQHERKDKMDKTHARGHLAAVFTILLWGTTFISTKVLLADFKPVEILFYRFLLGFFLLFLMKPKRLETAGWKQERLFVVAGLTGICLYYLLENIALTYTLASNVGVIVSVAPFFTAILAHLFIRGEEKPRGTFFVGFVVAMAGIALISFQGTGVELNPTGDLLAVLAAFVWGIYSIATKKISEFGYSTILTTRRSFFYGILFMIPALFLFDFNPAPERFANPVNLFNILFLGLGASAVCFVTWNLSVKILGAVKSSVYIYLTPVITIIASVLILHEPFTKTVAVGAVLTLTGLVLSETGKKK